MVCVLQAGAANVALHEDPFLQSMVQFVDDAGTVPTTQEHNLPHIMEHMQMLHGQQLQAIMHLHRQSTQQIGLAMNQQQQLIQQSICMLQNLEANIHHTRHYGSRKNRVKHSIFNQAAAGSDIICAMI